MGVQLNVNIAGKISELKDMMKDFELKLKLYRVLLRGKALEFEGYRQYGPEDDSSVIDWKASMRSNKLMVKQYREEQDLKIMFVVDVGEHMVSGSTDKLKCEYAAEATASLAHLILDSGDKVGLIVYSGKIKDVIMPKRGLKHFQYFTDVLSDSSTYGGGSNLSVALDFLIDYVDESIKGVVLVSDFIRFPAHLMSKLSIIGKKFETFAIMVKDPLDVNLPNVSGEVVIENPVNGQQLLINPKVARASYAQYSMNEQNRVLSMFKHANIDILPLTTDMKFAPMLSEFLRKRAVENKGI